MISTSSLVIAACRPRLYFIRSELIISDAFFEALSIALRLYMDRVQLTHVLKSAISNIGWDIPGALFCSVTFDEGGEDGVSERKLRKILGDFFFLFVLPEAIYTHPGQPNSTVDHSSALSKRTRTLESASRVHLLLH